MMARRRLSTPRSTSMSSWNSSRTTTSLLPGALTLSSRPRASSRRAGDAATPGLKLTSTLSPTGVVVKVGTMRKLDRKCLTLSSGKSLKTPRRTIAAKSSMLLTCCMLRNSDGRPVCATALRTRLDLP